MKILINCLEKILNKYYVNEHYIYNTRSIYNYRYKILNNCSNNNITLI